MSSKDLVKGSGSAANSALARTTLYTSNVPSPQPQLVLEEDEYIEALSKIIERDFFPDLAKLKRQHTYLEAVKMNDVQRIQAAARDIAGNDTPLGQRRLRTPARTPRISSTGLPDASWTPARVDAEATPTWHDDINSVPLEMGAADTPVMDTPSLNSLRKSSTVSDMALEGKNVDTSLSLDQFQARYTSEDNASFNDIVEKINAQKREKYNWMYDQEKKHQRLIESGRNPDQKLLRQDGESEDGSGGTSSDAGTQDGNMALPLVVADRTSVIPTWEYKAKNSLMYYPEGLGTTLNLDSMREAPKEIVHRNTGFQGRDLLVVNQVAAKKAAKVDPTSYLNGTMTDSPKVRGFGFVSSTPSPSMSQMGDDPDMMTWGTIEDEPLLISSGFTDSGPSPFKLPSTPRRELIAQKLTEKASKRIRENPSLRAKVYSTPSISGLTQLHSAIGGTTPTPRFNSPYSAVARTPLGKQQKPSQSRLATNRMASPSPRARTEMLSPAAKTLLDRTKNSRAGGADAQLRSWYGDSGDSSPGSSSQTTGGHRYASVTPSPLHRQQ